MTYSSRIWLISRGAGNFFLPWVAPFSSCTSSRMMSLHSSTHSSQTNTEGPAISLRTSCWLLPQKEQYRSFSPLPSPLPVWLLSAILKPHYRLRIFCRKGCGFTPPFASNHHLFYQHYTLNL